MSTKSHLFTPPITKKFNEKIYYITDGTKPFSIKQDALKKAQRIRKDGIACRVIKMNGKYFLYSKQSSKIK